MADGVVIILDSVGDDAYKQSAREFLTSPIKADMLRVLLDNTTQINNNIHVRNSKSFGSTSNRDISLRNFIKSTDLSSLIIDIPLNPPILLDGQTYFETELEANSEMNLMFYFDQEEIGSLLQ